MESTIKTLQEIVKKLKREVALIEEEIGTIAGGGYIPAGSVTFANLPALADTRYGFVYNIKDDFITTSDFVEGPGKAYSAGTNVGIVKDELGTLKYDVFAAFINIADIYNKIDAKQDETLSKEIAGETTVEGALEALEEITSDFTIDTEMDITSDNPVENKVIKAALDGKLDKDGKAKDSEKSDFATKAKNDALGNEITKTYATKNELSGYQKAIQVTTMPVASIDEVNKVYQYVGNTGTYVKGYFYECVGNEGVYSWQRINVQPGGSGPGGTDDYSELINKPSINGVELAGDLSAEDIGVAGGYEYDPTSESVIIKS